MVKFSDLYEGSEEVSLEKALKIPPKESKLGLDERFAEKVALKEEKLKKVRKAFYEQASDYLNGVYRKIRERKQFDLESGFKIVRKMVEINRTDSFLFLQAIYSDNPNKYAIYHPVNVAIYAIKMAQTLGWNKEKQVEIGMLGLLHDVGMAVIPEKIIYKQKDLDKQEFRFFKGRPDLSYNILKNFSDKYGYLADYALQVHERIDGSGYPKGIKGDEIHEYAQIIGLVDMYEALVHSRPFREKYTHFFAIKEIVNSGKNFFQRKHYKALLEIFSAFPMYSYVRLNSNAIGQVIETYPYQPMRPKIKIVYDSQQQRVLAERIVNLPDNPLLYIAESVSEEEIQKLSAASKKEIRTQINHVTEADIALYETTESVIDEDEDEDFYLEEGAEKFQTVRMKKTNRFKVALFLVVLVILVIVLSRQFGDKVFDLVYSDNTISPVTSKMVRQPVTKISPTAPIKQKDKKTVLLNLEPVKSDDSQPAVSEVPYTSSQKTARQKEVSKKSAHPAEAERVSYPYSIQVATLSIRENAEKEVTFYKNKGLPSYWVKVNLKDKGPSFAIYVGHFENAQEAQKTIKVNQLKGALVRNTKYATLIGIYSSKEALNAKFLSLMESGYAPYIIEDNNKYYLFVGAFITEKGVKNMCSELISSGFQCQVVER